MTIWRVDLEFAVYSNEDDFSFDFLLMGTGVYLNYKYLKSNELMMYWMSILGAKSIWISIDFVEAYTASVRCKELLSFEKLSYFASQYMHSGSNGISMLFLDEKYSAFKRRQNTFDGVLAYLDARKHPKLEREVKIKKNELVFVFGHKILKEYQLRRK